jgi:hypothetical protein
MKKTTLSLAVGICLSITGLAQTQRTILFEEFSGENCAPCASTNPYVVQTIHSSGNVPNKIVKVTFQVPIPSAPGANSLYGKNMTEPNQRVKFYNVPFAPYSRFNGGELPNKQQPPDSSLDGHAGWITQQYINDSSIMNAPFALNMTHVINNTADSITLNCTITAAQNFSVANAGNLKLFIALEESEIHVAAPTGTNGEKDFYDVMRKMIPDTSGTVLNNTFTNGQTQNFTFKIKLPAYLYDKSQIAFVGWIQDVTPVVVRQCDYGTGAGVQNVSYMRVHQAGYSAPVPLTLDAATSSVGNTLIQCSTTITPVAIIKNAGATTLTSCTISYKLDAGTAQTQPWTGSLAAGQTATVTLPAIVTTAGTHTVTISTSMPNSVADLNTGNDSKSTLVIIEPATAGAAPLTQGFVSSTFPPTGWALNNADRGAYSWKRSATYGGYQTSTNSAQYQSYSNASDGDIDELYVQTVDLTTIVAPQLKYDYAYNYFEDVATGQIYYDSLAILLSTDCGLTWNTLVLEGGPGLATASSLGGTAQFKPVAAEWKSNTVSLAAYATNNNVLIKFNALNHYGNDMFIDNINIAAVTGIAKNNGSINNVKVYPNPASSQFNINVNLATAQKTTVTLYNVMGQVVLSKNYDFTTGENLVNIPADQLSNGIYTVLVSSGNGTYQTKISIIK